MSRYYSGSRPRGRGGYRGGGGMGYGDNGGSRFYSKDRREYGGGGAGVSNTRAQLEIAQKLVDTLMNTGGGGGLRRSASNSEHFSSSFKRPRDGPYDRPVSSNMRRYDEGYNRRGGGGGYRRNSAPSDNGYGAAHRRSVGSGGGSHRGSAAGRGGGYSSHRGGGGGGVYRNGGGGVTDNGRFRSRNSNNSGRVNNVPRSFMTLRCPHCKTRCSTFAAYRSHQLGANHMAAMKRIVVRIRTELTRLRLAQRETQQELEKKHEAALTKAAEQESADGESGGAASDALEQFKNQDNEFCSLCELSYREMEGVVHEETEWHKKQKNYQNPSCTMCGSSYPSRIAYEKHLGSLTHLQKQNRSEKLDEKNDAAAFKQGDFLTLDEVGDVDGADDQLASAAGSNHTTSTAAGGKQQLQQPKKRKSAVEESSAMSSTKQLAQLSAYDGKKAVASEFMRKTEVYHCDLCDIYIKITNKIGAVLTKHCMGKKHYDNHRRRLTRLAEQEQQAAAAALQEAKVTVDDDEGTAADGGGGVTAAAVSDTAAEDDDVLVVGGEARIVRGPKDTAGRQEDLDETEDRVEENGDVTRVVRSTRTRNYSASESQDGVSAQQQKRPLAVTSDTKNHDDPSNWEHMDDNFILDDDQEEVKD